jgi:hypothetical protein
MMDISPLERSKINALVSRLGLQQIPSDTNIMAWVLPVLERIVRKFDGAKAVSRPSLGIQLPKINRE